MQAIVAFLKRKWVMQLIGVAVLCAVIWFAGPQVAFAHQAPFEPALHRLLAILVIIMLWLGCNWYLQTRANQTDRQLIAALSTRQEKPAQDAVIEAQDAEVETLRRSFEEALRLLKETQSTSKRDKQYLYELPWYVIIGPPGSGKTTLLSNSGLRFPLSERLGKSDFRGVGGTRHCDWFFAEEAIFLDTAGRYATQDSHQPVDAAGWRGFLDLVKKYRPQRPINGVLVALSMSDLLAQSEEAHSRLARVIRQRVLELYDVFGIQFPIYLLLTKCDLVAGFSDFFADLGQAERAQVWGETFPGDDPKQTENSIAHFDDHCQDLLGRLQQRTLGRLQEERDLQRRALILNFPQQMALLKPVIMRFLLETFDINRYEAEPWLRGVYFTSATQEGTPIDRVMGHLAVAYGLDRHNLPVFSGRGRSFFITRLLHEVIFPEAELAGVDPQVARRQWRWRWVVYAAVLVFTVGGAALWWASYERNRRAITQVERHIAQYAQGTAGLDAGEQTLLERLHVLQAAHDVYERRSWGMRLGLYQGDKLQAGVDHVYKALLNHDLLPRIQRRIEQRMLEQMRRRDAADIEILFELLKVYLMLGRPDKLDTRIAATWIQKDWEQSLALDPHAQAQFRAHVNNLLELKGSYEPIRLDGELITMVRRKLTAIPSALQLYADFKNEILADHARDFRLQDILGPRAPQVFGPTVQTLMIPGLYTYDGYSAIFQTQVFAFIEARLKRNWILENPQVDQSHDVRLLYDDLQALYFRDYTKAWRHLLESLRVKQPQGVHEAIQILDLLSGRDAPFLKTLLVAVERNTSLTRAPTIDSSDKRQGQENDAERKRSLETAQRAWQNDSQPPPARNLERHFEDLNTLVRSTGNSPPPLENILRLLSEVRGSLLQSSNDTRNAAEAQRIVKGQTSAASASDVFSKAEMEFRLLPEPLKSWLLSFTTFGQQADREGIAKAVKSNLEARKSELNAIWKKDVLQPCSTGLDGRYPLVPHSQTDATIADFSRFFAPNGHIERFFHSHLQPFVDTTAPRWQQVSMEKHTIGLSAELLQQLQYAEKIRKTFFATGGSTPAVQFELEPIALDANASSFELNIEGEAAEYAHGPIRPKTFRWPGPQPDAGVRLLFKPLVGNSVSKSSSGPWAWLRALDKAIVKKPGLNDRFLVTFQVDSYKADYELHALSVDNPFQLKELQLFRCPGSL